MCDDVFWEIQSQISNVCKAVEVFFACRHNRFWIRQNHVVHDGQVMRSEIPNDGNIMLKEAQIDSGRIIIVKVAESSVIDELSYLFYSTGEQEGVVHHDFEILTIRQFNQGFGLVGI